MPAAFELAAVQGGKLGLELLVFPFELSVDAVLPVQFLVEFLDNMLVMALRALDALIMVPNHLWRHAFQIGAPMPVGADKLLVQFGETGHEVSPPEPVGANASWRRKDGQAAGGP